MRWPRIRRREDRREAEETAQDVATAREALAELETAKARARERTSEISEIARTLRRLGEQNHFAPLVKDALGSKFR